MQYKTINSKFKEIYFNPTVVSEEREIRESNNMFWEKMNVLAIQNISLQQIKMA